jgi:hypothetical protein
MKDNTGKIIPPEHVEEVDVTYFDEFGSTKHRRISIIKNDKFNEIYSKNINKSKNIFALR